jgi:hypothetical protein
MSKQDPIYHVNIYRDPLSKRIHISDEAFTSAADAGAEIPRFRETFGFEYLSTATTWVKRDLSNLGSYVPTNPQTYADMGMAL